MAFQDDVKKKISENNSELAAKRAEQEKLVTEKTQIAIEQASNCAYEFYNKCVEAAALGNKDMTMYIADLLGSGGYYHSIGIITQAQGLQAIKSPVHCYDEWEDEDYHRNAKPLPEVVAVNAADRIEVFLRQKGLLNTSINLIAIHKYINHSKKTWPFTSRWEKANQIEGYYIKITSSW